MQNRIKNLEPIIRITILLTTICIIFFSVPVYALELDLGYSYKTENTEEFVITGKSNININGEIADYLRDIYDV